MTDLLTRLRSRNVLRCQRDFHHDIESWSVLEWAGAMAGEAGEATNFAKKITRGDHSLGEYITRKGVTQTVAEHLADEVADTIIYGDLLCARVGVSLTKAIVRKFNATSAERGSDILLDDSANTASVQFLRCATCHTEEAFTTGDPEWCPYCHAQGKRVAR